MIEVTNIPVFSHSYDRTRLTQLCIDVSFHVISMSAGCVCRASEKRDKRREGKRINNCSRLSVFGLSHTSCSGASAPASKQGHVIAQ